DGVDRFRSANLVALPEQVRRLAVAVIKHGHDPARSRVQVGEHVAQLGLHVRHDKLVRTERDEWHRWIAFDDLWAGVHPALATAILRHGKRWDVLSAPNRPSPEPG